MTLEIGKSTDNISRSVSGIPSRLTKDLDAKGYYIVDAQNYIDMLSGKGSKYFFDGTDDTIYITDAGETGWDSATVSVTVKMSKLT
jgi:hypothetical protein